MRGKKHTNKARMKQFAERNPSFEKWRITESKVEDMTSDVMPPEAYFEVPKVVDTAKVKLEDSIQVTPKDTEQATTTGGVCVHSLTEMLRFMKDSLREKYFECSACHVTLTALEMAGHMLFRKCRPTVRKASFKTTWRRRYRLKNHARHQLKNA